MPVIHNFASYNKRVASFCADEVTTKVPKALVAFNVLQSPSKVLQRPTSKVCTTQELVPAMHQPVPAPMMSLISAEISRLKVRSGGNKIAEMHSREQSGATSGRTTPRQYGQRSFPNTGMIEQTMSSDSLVH